MESLLLSIISQYLKDYVNNFKRDQVSLNFLRGQGVIRNLDINVGAINEAIFQSSVPALRFTRIMINTLSVEAPIMNLKNKPITFFIDRLFIEIAEVVDIEKRPPKKTPKKATSAKYGFIDRVLDCLSFEINRTTIAVQTLGRMKTTTVGPWTPPVVLIELSGARVFCTNHNGFETELDECLRIRPTKRPLLFLYKKLEVEKASFHLINPELWVVVAEELVKDVCVANLSGLNLKSGMRGFVKLKIFNNTPLQVTMSMRKRMDNNFLLGLEIAITIEAVKINLRKNCLTELIHFVMGMHFCLFRLDSIQELFGLDPYSEGFTTTSLGVGLSRSPSVATSVAASDRRNRRRAQFGQAENESLDQLEAEMITGGAVVAADEDERAEDWHRSSLNSDDDPPHMRFVTVIQVTDATIVFHLDHDDPPADQDSIATLSSKHSKNHKDASVSTHSDSGISSLPAVVILSLQGLVHTTVSPEHAAATESVIQTTLKSLGVTEQVGIRKTRLLWTKEPLDSDGRPIFIAPLPRGVKEYSHDDLETIPGTSFILKKNSRYPPPPIAKGTAISSEMCICELGVHVKVETFDSMTALFMSSWDERVGSGDWGQIPLGVIVTTIKAGSSESVIILSGLDIVISPSMDLGPTEDLVPHATPHTPSAPKGCLMPSEINLRVGLMTLVRKPSMDISIMSPLLRVDHGLGPEDEIGQEDGSDEIEDQDEENENACRETSSHGSGVQFPHHAHDLSQALRAVIEFDTQKGDMSTPEKATPCPPGGGAGTVDTSSVPCGVASAPLLKVRFEASMAEVSLSISADLPQRRSHNISRPLYTTSSSGSGSGLFRSTSNRRVDDAPPSRQLVKPFSLHYVSSLDLHPFLPSPSLTGPSSAYNREYSLSPNSFTISSSYLSVDGLAINSSLLDLIRALNVIETTAHMVRVSRGYGLVFRPPQPLKQASAGGLNSSAADGSPLPPASLQQQIEDESEEAVKHASLSMFKCSNVDIAIVPASDGSAPAVLALVTEFVHIVLERPHTTAASPGNAEGELPLRLMQSGSQTSSSGHSVGDGERETVGAFEKEREVKSAREGEGDREEESEREGDKESISSSPDDWSDWICDDRHSALHAIAASSAAASALPTVARALTYDAAPQRQHRTVVKLVCGNLMLSTKGSPLLCLHASSTVRDALSLVTQRCFVGAQRRPQAAVGDSAPFLLIRCELSCTPRQSRRVESIGESKLHPFERAVPGDPPIGPNGHQASSAVYPQHSRDPLSSMSLQVEVPCCSVKESPTKHASGSRSAGKGKGTGDGKGTGKGNGKGVGNQGAEDGKRIGQVVLVPQAFEGCLQGLLRELLEGFGFVRIGASRWWDDSVFGYITERAGRSRGSAPADAACSGPESTRVLGFDSLGFEIEAPSLSLVLLDPEEASKKTEADAAINEQQVAVDRGYAAVAFELAGLCVRGVMGGAEESSKNTEANGAPASARSLSVSLDASLYLFLSGACGLPTLPESAVLCASFPVRVNVSKIGSDPTSMTSSISMADFASTLALAPTSKAMGLLMDCEGYRQRALSVLKGFLGNIRNTIPSILPFRPHDVTVRSDSSPAAASPATTTKITDCDEMKAEAPPFPSATGDLLQQLRPVDPSAGETESMQEYVTAYGAPATSQRLITSQISRRLQSAHRSLEQLHLHSALPSHSASRAIEEALLVCVELQDAALRLRNAALVAFNMTPSYCGWVYRSQGFLSNPSRATGRRRSAHAKEGIGGTGGGVRSWMVLVMGNLLFMSQPYAGAVDISLSLDDIVVADPDESEIASMPMPTSLAEKVALSSSLWCIGTEGTLVLDCHSEKQHWLDALLPWLVGRDRDRHSRDTRSRSSTASSQPPRQSTVSSRTDGLESHMSGNVGHTRVQKLTASIGNAAAIMGAISSSLEDLGGASTQGIADGVAANAKKFQNATSGIMRAFATRNSLQSTFSASVRPKIPLLQTGYVDSPTGALREGQGQGLGGGVGSPHPSPTQSKGMFEKGPEDQTRERPESAHRDRSGSFLSSPAESKDGTAELGRERGRGCPVARMEDENSDTAGVIDLLDALAGPLVRARSLLESSLALSVELHGKSTSAFRAGLKDVAQSLMGISVLSSIADEVFAADEHRSEQCLLAVNSARSHLRHSAEAAVISNGFWRDAERRRSEQESLLQTCTVQHITTVVEMAARYDLLEERHSQLSSSVASPGDGSKSVLNFKDLLMDLKSSMHKTEQLLRIADEKEIMMAEELLSVRLESASILLENKSMREELENIRTQAALDAASHTAALGEEVLKTRHAEKARAALEDRVASVLYALGTDLKI